MKFLAMPLLYTFVMCCYLVTYLLSFQGSSAPAVVLETPLPGIGQSRTHVPVKITTVQLGAPQTLGPTPASSSDDSFAHDVLPKGMSALYEAKICCDF